MIITKLEQHHRTAVAAHRLYDETVLPATVAYKQAETDAHVQLSEALTPLKDRQRERLLAAIARYEQEVIDANREYEQDAIVPRNNCRYTVQKAKAELDSVRDAAWRLYTTTVRASLDECSQ